MNNLKEEAIQFIKHLQTLYFEQRDLSALLSVLTDDTSWIGTGAQEFCRDLVSAQEALALEEQEYNGCFTIIMENWDVSCISETAFVVYGEIIVQPDDSELADVYNRISAVCIKTAEGMKLLHLHMSSPDADQEPGHFFVKRENSVRRETLRMRAENSANELKERNDELEALTENIPGGVHQCANDMDLTLLSMSSGFLNMFGYTREEISDYFQDKFIYMVHEEDRFNFVKAVCEQLTYSSNVEFEYRVQCKDGRIVWVLDRGRVIEDQECSETFFCMLLDITEQKAEMEELRLTLERHQIIMNQTTDIIFEWDITKDTLTFSSNWRKKFGYEAIKDSISEKIPLSENIHPNDMKLFMKIMMDAAAGVPYSETEFRIRDAFGNFRWHRIRATVQYDNQQRPIKAVGVILDIDADKKQNERLLEQVQRDPLTNLYNKLAVRDLVTKQINENTGDFYQALLIIDLDNFKGVNDTFGHLCGDSLLSDVASVLKSHFHVGDIVGRIGGDEFLVYLPKVAEKEEAAKKIQSLLASLGSLKPRHDASPISCSIGVAFFKQGVADYITLYKCADSALYQIKAQGKNNFAFYDSENSQEIIACSTSDSAVGGIDSSMDGSGDRTGDMLAQYTFRMLYDSIDTAVAVEHLIEIIGRSYNMSRVYIIESSLEGHKYNNTFEWCNVGTMPKIQIRQNIEYDGDFDNYLQNFNQNNIFYCRDVYDRNSRGSLSPYAVRSFLHCAILDDGEFKGYIGFDECRENHWWTFAQVASLTLIGNVIATFLLKQRFKERASRNRNPSFGTISQIIGERSKNVEVK